MNNIQEKSNEIKVIVKKVLHYKAESGWGIVSVVPVKEDGFGFSPKLNFWNNFVIRGNMPIPMNVDQEYSVEISELKTDPKYGEFYELNRIHIEVLNTVDSQQRFLAAILSAYQSSLILAAFPNSMIIDDITNDKINLVDIKGIGDKTAEEIKSKVIKNKDMGALMVELSDFNFSSNMLKKIVNHFKSSTRALIKVKESLYYLCYISGISFERVDKTALARGEDKFGHKRIAAYLNYYFNNISQQGHSWANERVLLEDSIKGLDIIATYVRDYLETEDGKKNFIWRKSEGRISSVRMYTNEKNTLMQLLRISRKYVIPKSIDVTDEIKEAESKLGVIYTDEQKGAMIEALNYGVFILNGAGGTGKTTVVKGLVEIVKSIGKRYISCALSGKASQVLISKDINSGTIHKVFRIGQQECGELQEDVVIVDESSMVNAEIFSFMLSNIKDGAMIILVGDSGQLSGIGHGDVLRDLLRTKYFKTVELLQIHRQAQDSGIIEFASMIRNGKQVCSGNFNGVKTYGVKKDMLFIGYKEKENILMDLKDFLVKQAANIKTHQNLMDIQIAVATREKGDLSAKSINILAQSIFNDISKDCMSSGGYDYREGDKVIVKGNSYSIKYYKNLNEYHSSTNIFTCDREESKASARTGDLFNGTMGIVKAILYEEDEFGESLKKLVVEFENFGLVVLKQKDLGVLDLAYAVTCHRLQGSTIKNVIVVLDYSAYSLLSRQWVYTAITRASKKCILLAQSSALVKAISVDSSGERQTFLGEMIIELEKKAGKLEEIIKKPLK